MKEIRISLKLDDVLHLNEKHSPMVSDEKWEQLLKDSEKNWKLAEKMISDGKIIEFETKRNNGQDVSYISVAAKKGKTIHIVEIEDDEGPYDIAACSYAGWGQKINGKQIFRSKGPLRDGVGISVCLNVKEHKGKYYV